ncbi:MAG: hypothetical protein KDD82_20310 [Planctomycetes bacterium]|nr:hypothetical protein [Planctomycetota bacterium]
MNVLILVSLFCGGLAFLALELFLPGAILGAIGALMLLAAVSLTFVYEGPLAGGAALLGSCGAGAAFVKLGVDRLALRKHLAHGTGTSDRSHLIGMVGEAISPLRPGGIAKVGGLRVDVVTAGEHVDSGTPVEVVAVAGSRIEVRKKA